MRIIFNILCLIMMVNFGESIITVEKLKLSSGYQIPQIGLGTSTIKLDEMEKAINSALDIGYRYIDTAFIYNNEAAIGKALKTFFKKGGKREELFILSKLAPQGNHPDRVEKYFNKSLDDLGLDYLDMYLIHQPFGSAEGKDFEAKQENNRPVLEVADHIAIWKAMEKLVKNGRAKSIGLSNFNESQIKNIYGKAEIKPSNLQIELHAYHQQKELRKFCKERNIVVTAFAPLGSQSTRDKLYKGTEKNLRPLIELPLIQDLSKKYKKSPSQILLRQIVQNCIVAIPKSANAERQKSNIDVFSFQLTPEDMKKIEELDEGEKGRVFDFSKMTEGLNDHPQKPF